LQSSIILVPFFQTTSHGWSYKHIDQFYIDHDHPFGASCASSNAGIIANAIVNIWIAEGVKPILKCEDDLNIFHYPLPDGPFIDGIHHFQYDHSKALHHISSLNIPWHPDKGDPFFSSKTTFIGMLWDLKTRCVSLPVKKWLKFLHQVNEFITNFEQAQCQL